MFRNILTNAVKTHCKNGHEFDKENTYIVPKGRHCKACMRLNGTRYRAEKKLAKAGKL